MATSEDVLPTAAQIDSLLELLPALEELASEVGTARRPGSSDLAQLAERVHDAAASNAFLFPFDWPAWQDVGQRYVADAKLLQSADLQIIRKLLTMHVRTNRFCDGHLEEMVERGHMRGLLQRLHEIREGMRAA